MRYSNIHFKSNLVSSRMLYLLTFVSRVPTDMQFVSNRWLQAGQMDSKTTHGRKPMHACKVVNSVLP